MTICFFVDLIYSLRLRWHLKKCWLEDDPASFWVWAYFQGRIVSFRAGRFCLAGFTSLTMNALSKY